MTTDTIDLVPQLGALPIAGEELQYFTLQDTSPKRPKMTLWNKETGESWDFYNFRVPSLLQTGRWTRTRSEVPEIVRSQYPCFLAPESAMRAELDSLGIVVRCNSKHPSKFAMEQVAAKKHPNSWKAWQAHLAEKEKQADRDRQDAQIAAMMQLAAQNSPQPAEAPVPCDVEGCDFEAKNAFGLQAHKRNKHGGA